MISATPVANTLIGESTRGRFCTQERQTSTKHPSATMRGEIVISIMFLGIIVATDYMHSIQAIPISSAIPTQIFQLMVMANQMVREETGEGILKLIWRKITRLFGNDN